MRLWMLTPMESFVYDEEVKRDGVHGAAGRPEGKLEQINLVGSDDDVNNFPGLACTRRIQAQPSVRGDSLRACNISKLGEGRHKVAS